MERLKQADFQAKVLNSDKPVLVDFYSDSCVPCKMLSPVLYKLEAKYGDKLFIGKVNIAYEQDLIDKYGVSAAPTLVLFKSGEEVFRKTGFTKQAELEQIIDNNL